MDTYGGEDPATVKKYLDRCVELSNQNVDDGGLPFATIVVKDGKVICEAVNTTHKSKDVTAHAEIEAIRSANKILDSPFLTDCDVYIGAHPCAMCLGALIYAKPKRTYFAVNAEDKKAHGIPSIDEQIFKPYTERNIKMYYVEVKEGVEPLDRFKEALQKNPNHFFAGMHKK